MIRNDIHSTAIITATQLVLPENTWSSIFNHFYCVIRSMVMKQRYDSVCVCVCVVCVRMRSEYVYVRACACVCVRVCVHACVCSE